MTPEQCRAARAYLGMTQRQLAALSGVTTGTIRNFEARATVPIRTNLQAILEALEDEGVIWIDGDVPGLQFEERQADLRQETVH